MNAKDFYINPGQEPKGGNVALFISAGQTMGQFALEMEDAMKEASPEDQELMRQLMNKHIDDYYENTILGFRINES